MAPGNPTEGRAISAAGEENAPDDVGRVDPPQRKWEARAHQGAVQAQDPRISPDPLQPTDRYRLVTPFKLKL